MTDTLLVFGATRTTHCVLSLHERSIIRTVRTGRQYEQEIMHYETHSPCSLRHLMSFQLVGRMLLGPIAAGTFAGIELAGRGAVVAGIGGYTTFVAAQMAVVFWGRWQLHRARLRLAAVRARSDRLAGRRQ